MLAVLGCHAAAGIGRAADFHDERAVGFVRVEHVALVAGAAGELAASDLVWAEFLAGGKLEVEFGEFEVAARGAGGVKAAGVEGVWGCGGGSGEREADDKEEGCGWEGEHGGNCCKKD